MFKYFFTLCFLFSSALMAQEKQIVAVENAVAELVDAMVAGDASRLEKITDPNLSYGHSNGLIENQSEFIKALTSGVSNFTEIDIQNQTVSVTGKTALVRHFLIGKTHNKDSAPGPVNLGVLTVWQKKGKSWILLARQAYKR
ncbi:nuclear transport factor 2 family protein [Cyclobacterium sp. 1_MG-2023]|uniref:nuclear transport factor 2 family protein n=1 Tax=Cyclobacterium sp. 1_MG-2023 TaxID=3062681 RepID=UPI0026E1E8AD|nr:nuclear transport factor 2 family protein [Cyclobacterium sp. 1_MG-2023]MDO6437533.1 nuclear transport factor 2 family protein [Cyclobacterium sp. 1_MG-2023]